LAGDHNLVKFLLKSVAMCVAISICVFIALLAVFTAIDALLDLRLPLSGTVFMPITAAFVVLLLHAPFEVVCHLLVRPQGIVASKSLRLIIAVTLGMLWGIKQGAAGAGKALLVSTIVSLVMIAGFTAWSISRRPVVVRRCT
jgi:hypothetical protein